jgi:hypothetical protein
MWQSRFTLHSSRFTLDEVSSVVRPLRKESQGLSSVLQILLTIYYTRKWLGRKGKSQRKRGAEEGLIRLGQTSPFWCVAKK